MQLAKKIAPDALEKNLANNAQINPRYRNSSERPAVQASTANSEASDQVRGMIFSVMRNSAPRFSTGSCTIFRNPAVWPAHRSKVAPQVAHAARHGSAIDKPSSA